LQVGRFDLVSSIAAALTLRASSTASANDMAASSALPMSLPYPTTSENSG
jgi:hypothetical protein